MKFEAIGPDGKVKYTTEYVSCIDLDALDARARAGYKFRLDGKTVSKIAVKAYVDEHSDHVVTSVSSEASSCSDKCIKPAEPVKRSVKSIRCINNGKVYKNMSEAGRDLNLDSALISYSLKVNRPTKGYSFEFVE